MSFFICTFCYLLLLGLYSRQRALFFVLLPFQRFLLCRHSAARPVGRAAPPSFAMPLLQAFSLRYVPFFPHFAGALPITITAALLRPSFVMPLPQAFSLFFTLLQLFILCRRTLPNNGHNIAPSVFCHASRAGVLSCACALPVFRRGVTTLRQRSARI